MESEKLVLTEIKITISRFLPESDVILFGSRARGDNHNNSDYDLLVITKSSINNQQRLYFQALIRKTLAKQHILADIIIHSFSDIKKKQSLPGHIIRSAIQEGVRVWMNTRNNMFFSGLKKPSRINLMNLTDYGVEARYPGDFLFAGNF